MDIISQVRRLITNKPFENHNLIVTREPSTFQKYSAQIFAALGLSLIYYILSPSFPFLLQFGRSNSENSNKSMFTKRPDKYTTGFINLRNDCFANSSIQAYLSLPSLTDYLNSFILSFNKFDTFISENDVDIKDLNDKMQNSDNDLVNPKFRKLESNFNIPLHISLATVVKKLQSTQMTSRTISVWTFLHDLEKIFNAKISRSQHDAQELTQLINETLENENLRVIRRQKWLLDDYQANHNQDKFNRLKQIEIPEFPLNGLVMTQMKCLNCNGTSSPSFSPFLMLTLHAPQTSATDISTLLGENESETIEGYQCLNCRVKFIVNNENYLEKNKDNYNPDVEEQKIIDELKKLNQNEKFCINEDLPEEIETYIKGYKKHGADISKISSTVLRKNQILKPPKIFGLHLSRSDFNGMNVTRNSCRISFRDHLKLSIGKEYHEDLKYFQSVARENTSYQPKNFDSKVLTTDINDMEDEAVQREDVDYMVDSNESNQLSTTDDDDDDYADYENSKKINGGNQEDSSSLSNSSASSILTTQQNGEDFAPSSSSLKTPESLNNAPITTDQTDDLLNHFHNFKFSDNDVYKYKLKAVIRHHGSHTQGHYECYKRKPLFVKDKEGMIIKISPEIFDEVVELDDFDNLSLKTAGSNSTRDKDSGSTTTKGNSSAQGSSDVIASLSEDNVPEPPGAFRRKFSNMMGRRPSIIHADPDELAIQEIDNSGLNTPAEFHLKDVDKDYFDNSLSEKVNEKLTKEINSQDQIKLKKIPSLLKNPFWKINDSIITEVSKGAVLCETSSVYMLYYERVDKRH